MLSNTTTSNSIEIHTCEVCGNDNLNSCLNLGNHPLCDDLVPINDTRTCIEYPIEILYCSVCFTAHQRFQVPKHDLFPKSYHYRSRFTADVLKGMISLVEATQSTLNSDLKNKVVLDIGCNDGSLLNFFKEQGAITIGIEPTNAYEDALNKGHVIYNDFFSPESAAMIKEKHGIPDIITFTNVFAHIENLTELIESLKLLISPDTLLVIENHYLGAVIDKFQFDTFYHEHPRTYSLNSFINIAKSLKLELSDVQFPSRYGGNIRVFLGGPESISKINPSSLTKILEEEVTYGTKLKDMQDVVDNWKSQMSLQLKGLFSKHGKLSAKAFPGRAAILVKLLNLDSEIVDVVYEKPGSMKLNHYLPGTRIPIISDEILFSKNPKPELIINFAWHISNEIKGYLANNKINCPVLDILNPDEIKL